MRHAPSLDTIRLFGCAACLAQLVITTILPLILWFSVFKLDIGLQYLAFMTWGAAGCMALLGLLAFVSLHSLVLGMHAVLATATAACLGAVQTSSYLLLVDRCAMSQVTFSGCSNCTCAPSNRCTKVLLSSDFSCQDCKATATDVCEVVTDKLGLAAYMGLVCLLALALPAVLSLQAFSRLEIEGSSISNRLQYARNVVSREVNNLEMHLPASVHMGILEELVSVMLAYGHAEDKGLALRCCSLANMEIAELAASLGGAKALESVVVSQNSPGMQYLGRRRRGSIGSRRSSVRVAPESPCPWSTATAADSGGAVLGALCVPGSESARSAASISLQQALPSSSLYPSLAAAAPSSPTRSNQAVWGCESPKRLSRLNPTAASKALQHTAAGEELEPRSFPGTPTHSLRVLPVLPRGQTFKVLRLPTLDQAASAVASVQTGSEGLSESNIQVEEPKPAQPLPKQVKKKLSSKLSTSVDSEPGELGLVGHDSLRRPGREGASVKKKGKGSKKLADSVST